MFKLRNLFWLAILISGYNYIFDDEPEKLEKLKKDVAPIVEKTTEKIKTKAKDLIANPVDVSVFEGKDTNPKNEKLVSEPKKDEPKGLERLEVSPNKVKEKRPIFKSID